MGIPLPERIGEPAPKDIAVGDRFVNPAIALTKELADGEGERRVLKLVRSGDLQDVTGAYKDLAKGRMPRRAGIVRLGGASVMGAIDTQAAVVGFRELILFPQPKDAVNPTTKEICQSGVISLSEFDPVTGNILRVTPFAEAVNPDEDKWRAMELGITRYHKPNDYGLVILNYEGFELPLRSQLPRIDLNTGATSIPTIG